MKTFTPFLVFAAVLAIGFGVLLHKLWDRVERQYLEAAEEPMVDAAHLLASLIETAGTDTLAPTFDSAHARIFQAQIYTLQKNGVGMHAYVTDEKGIVVFDSEHKATGEDYSKMRDVGLTLRGSYGARSTKSPHSILVVGAPIRAEDGTITGCVSVSKPTTNMVAFIKETRRFILAVGWATYLGVLAATALALYWFSRPVARLARYATAVAAGERPSLQRSRNPDVAALGDALESMRDALEGRRYAETYVQTLTHEMKSPIAAVKAAAELLEDPNMPTIQREKFVKDIQQETTRLNNTTERLLALSTIESRRGLTAATPTDLSALAHEITNTLADPRLTTDIQPGIQARADRFLLEIAFSNLLQNALDHTPPEGKIHLTLKSAQKRATLQIQDTGPGIPDYALPRVFERFYSLPHPESGKKSTGLGLCFVQEAAHLHGGTATLENREEGAVATLEIPLSSKS